jgi:uncharacterized protein (DUF58 family)
VRAALAGLTTRGRCLLAAGFAAVLCALGLAQDDLLRVGVLLIALPLVCAAVLTRTRYRLASVRRVLPSRVPAGQEARVVLAIENVSRLPTGLMFVEDHVPYVLSSRPRFVLDRLESRGRREVSYPVRSDVRGRFVIGPLSVRLADPFGMCELARSFTARDTLVVTPVVHHLPTVQLGGEWAGSGESRARSLAAAGEDDVATREYRQGDELRRVHWRSTARQGQLMVRREEQPWQSRCSILLDTRVTAHRGDGPGSSFEWSVSAAASIGIHLARHGFAVRLVTDTGAVVSSAGHDADVVVGDFEGALLDALAVVQRSGSRSLRGGSSALRRGGGDGLVVAVLGILDHEEATDLARMRHGTTSGIAVLVDSGSWSGGLPRERLASWETYAGNVTVLRGSGWRVLEASAGDQLSTLWPGAARSMREVELPGAPSRIAP